MQRLKCCLRSSSSQPRNAFFPEKRGEKQGWKWRESPTVARRDGLFSKDGWQSHMGPQTSKHHQMKVGIKAKRPFSITIRSIGFFFAKKGPNFCLPFGAHAYLSARLFECTLIWAHAYLSACLFEHTLISAHAYFSARLFERTLIWANAFYQHTRKFLNFFKARFARNKNDTFLVILTHCVCATSLLPSCKYCL